jgi:hypothetical protein
MKCLSESRFPRQPPLRRVGASIDMQNQSLRAGTAAIGVALLALAGCGGSDLPLVPVAGKVTFAGGPCPKPGTIDFEPVAAVEGVPRRRGWAKFAEDGEFEATSFDEGDGLLPGTYAIKVSCWNGQPSGDDPSSFEKLNLVPKTFTQEVVVERNSDPIEVNIDVPKK